MHVQSCCFAYINLSFFGGAGAVLFKLFIAVIQNFCYHGNMTSYFSSPLARATRISEFWRRSKNNFREVSKAQGPQTGFIPFFYHFTLTRDKTEKIIEKLNRCFFFFRRWALHNDNNFQRKTQKKRDSFRSFTESDLKVSGRVLKL